MKKWCSKTNLIKVIKHVNKPKWFSVIRLVIILLLFISTAAAAQQIRQDSTGTHGADNLKQKTDSIGRKIRTATSFKTSLPDSLNPLKKGQKKIAGVDAKVKSMSHVDSLTFKPGSRPGWILLKLAYRQKAIALQKQSRQKKRKIKHSSTVLNVTIKAKQRTQLEIHARQPSACQRAWKRNTWQNEFQRAGSVKSISKC